MNNTTALTTVSMEGWGVMKEQGKLLVGTGFLPKAIDTPEKAIAIMLKGKELGIPTMYALSNINIIEGKPGASAELMLALIYRDHGDEAIFFTEVSDTVATAFYKRLTWRTRQSFSFTVQDAKRAGLSGNSWNKYPGAMLRARCISAIARLAFPDSIGGMYTPEELGATVDYETGEILDAPAIEPQQFTRGEIEAARYDTLSDQEDAREAAQPSLTDRITGNGHTEPEPPKTTKGRSWDPTKVWPRYRKPLEAGPTLTNDQVHTVLGVASLDEWFNAGHLVEEGWAKLSAVASAMISGASFEDALAAVKELEETPA